jgi:hypothetical protein
MWSSVRRACLAAAAALVVTAPGSAAQSRSVTDPSLVLDNGLGSRFSVTHSRVGPPLGFYQDSDCDANPFCFGPGIDVPARPRFVPGHRYAAVTIGGGPYESQQREHNIVLRSPETVLGPERGRISLWYRRRHHHRHRQPAVLRHRSASARNRRGAVARRR